MGVMDKVTSVVSALQDAGIRADRGYPSKMMIVPESPIVTVTVDASSQKETVLAVTVYGPADQGGRVCEELAQTTAEVLRGQKARCDVGPCRYDPDTGLYALPLLATWKNFSHNVVRIDGEMLAYVTDFSAVQTRQVEPVTDEETGQVNVVNEEVIWTVAVQELLPFSEVMEVDPMDAFTLSVVHDNCTETYPECYWLSITLEETDGGLIRKRIARSWVERTVTVPEE